MALITQIAPMLLALAAQAAEPTGTLTLACQGTTQWADDAKPEPTSMGIIIDFGARTIEGFGGEFPMRIVEVTETTIVFMGNNRDDPNRINKTVSIDGTIDRVTGAVTAMLVGSIPKKTWSASYFLKCKPAQRMF